MDMLYDESILSLTLDYMVDNNINKVSLSNMIDENRTSVSQYLNRKFDKMSQGTIDKIEEKLSCLIDNHTVSQSRKNDGHTPRPVIHKTSDAIGVIAICQSCQEYMGLGIVVGRSGFGKSYSLKYYAKSPNVAYVECNESMNARDLIKSIERALCLPHMSGSLDDRVDNIKDFFNANNGYLLIIDEADKLITKYTQKKAEILRNIYDQSDMGMVLAGEPALKRMIKQYIPRMASRIDFKYSLNGLLEEEAIEYISGYNFNDDAKKEIVYRATNDKNGCFRLLNRTFENIVRIVGEEKDVDISTVKKASSMMLL